MRVGAIVTMLLLAGLLAGCTSDQNQASATGKLPKGITVEAVSAAAYYGPVSNATVHHISIRLANSGSGSTFTAHKLDIRALGSDGVWHNLQCGGGSTMGREADSSSCPDVLDGQTKEFNVTYRMKRQVVLWPNILVR